jgi:signal transduction histidine kinase
MRRLYLQIYVAFVASLLLLALLASLAWLWLAPREDFGLDAVAAVVQDVLPASGAPREEVQKELEGLGERLGLSLGLDDARGRRLANVGEALPPIEPSWTQSRVLRSRGRGLTVALRLPDGRWLVARHERRGHALAAVTGMMLAAVAVAVGAFPLVRRLTCRLERLQARVDDLGEGDLSARVEVEGRDEIAKLAESFNRAAGRIERLVESQRMLLAGASHELRSPLTRIRMAVELLGPNMPESLRDRIERDVTELDALIGELILASRIEARQAIELGETIDVFGLAVEEGARFEASVTGSPVTVDGDEALVRRLLRNLLENARRHAPQGPVEVEVGPTPGTEPARALLRVLDRGAGVPAEERERIFEPFRKLGKSGDGGLGLGLALVQRIAALHGGAARCLPRDGGGSLFEVELGSIALARPGREGSKPRES